MGELWPGRRLLQRPESALRQPRDARGGEFQVNQETTNDQGYPKVASDPAGNFVVVWQSDGQDGSGAGVFARRYDKTGAALGPEFPVNTYTTGDQLAPQVATDAGGNFVVVWQSAAQDGAASGVFGQRFNNAGTAVGSEFPVNSYTTGDQRIPAVAMDAAGDFVVVWRGAGPTSADGVFARRFNSAGVPQGAESQVNHRDPELSRGGDGQGRRLHRRVGRLRRGLGA